jgi:hypothetical protein
LQVFRGQIDVHDLVCLSNYLVRYPLLYPHTCDLFHYVIERLEVLDIHRSNHIDAGVQQILDIFVPFSVPALWRVGMREFVHQGYCRFPSEDGVDVHLFERDTVIFGY